MHHYSLTVLIFVSLIISPVFSADDPRGLVRIQGFEGNNKVAVLVGVENYNAQISGFSSLNYAVDDVNRLRNTFQRQGYKVYSLVDSQATKATYALSLRRYETNIFVMCTVLMLLA